MNRGEKGGGIEETWNESAREGGRITSCEGAF